MDREKKTWALPKIGMRNIKTATAAAFCALLYHFFNRSPAFACIGAIFGMGSDQEQSKLHGGNRFFGTIIGGLIGMALFRIHIIFYPVTKIEHCVLLSNIIRHSSKWKSAEND